VTTEGYPVGILDAFEVLISVGPCYDVAIAPFRYAGERYGVNDNLGKALIVFVSQLFTLLGTLLWEAQLKVAHDNL
jgi:hypothetical protein